MANWQDIKALEERIYEAAEDGLHGAEDDGIYPMPELIRMGEDGKPEPDIDKISDVANSWIFLD